MRTPPALDEASARLLSAIDRLRALADLPLALARHLTDAGEIIDADVARWLAVLGVEESGLGLHSLLYAFREFRALYFHRLAHGCAAGALAGRLLHLVYRPTPGLSLETVDIGAGLFIAHGQATCLAAERIGRNCWVHHGVTIGWDYRAARAPIIGDDVFIGTGAVVLGAVTVGDGAKIGANAVVLCDVPAGATAVGSPARIVPASTGTRLAALA